MISIIINTLNKLEVSKYRINENVTESVELFFIKKKLDCRRITEKRDYKVTVFRDFESDGVAMLGSGTVTVQRGMDDEEIERVISDAYYAASFVKNLAYELPEPERCDKILPKSKIAELGLSKAAELASKAILSVDGGRAFVNSAEIFVIQRDIRIITSNGTDVSFRKYSINGEFVTQCKEPQDVEQHKQFSYDELDTEALSSLVSSVLRSVELRAGATSSPDAGSYDVLLTGDNLAEVMSYYVDRSDAVYVYSKYSDFEEEKNVQGEDTVGERLCMTLKANTPYSFEGVKIKDRELLCDGVLKSIHGTARFCRYLGKEPTGDNGGSDGFTLVLDNGSRDIAEFRQGRVLEPIVFSDFQMDSFSGYFSGEIRLALLHENGKTTALTGGSVSGSIFSAQKNMVFSKERYSTLEYDGPLGMLVSGISVAGK